MSDSDLRKFDPSNQRSWPIEKIKAEDLVSRGAKDGLFTLEILRASDFFHWPDGTLDISILTVTGRPMLLRLHDAIIPPLIRGAMRWHGTTANGEFHFNQSDGLGEWSQVEHPGNVFTGEGAGSHSARTPAG